ncbi:MAG: 50S ribosomal protein L29 [Armatimonadetes bacterium RBG_19FT_COMBO_69_19]|nr:MAG: 50S ribosomal protein L29 [Armatimonadetes bacterium RBG_19FT_COMBO_69_19]
MEVSDLREMGADELVKKLDDARKELFNLRMRIAGQQPNTTKIRELRRDVARLLSILSEKGVRV